ncbi:MAG: AzlD domain-containing protein [Solobacterium sp.]|nr:AzlD domain-containing protein [Solobacterium sp.]
MNGVYLVLASIFMTALLRFLPFVLWKNRAIPEIVQRLGRELPYAIMAMLVVYCLRNTDFQASFGIPEAIALVVTAGLHLYKRNSLISIATGTLVYMVLVQLVFV